MLKEDGQQLGYFAVLGLFIIIHGGFVVLQAEVVKKEAIGADGCVIGWHKTVYNNKWKKILFLVIFVGLHIAEKTIAAPASLPYLHNLLFAFFSFSINSYFLLVANLTIVE